MNFRGVGLTSRRGVAGDSHPLFTILIQLSGVMPQFFFHARGPKIGQISIDGIGQQLGDVSLARSIAVQTTKEVALQDPLISWDGWVFDIVDADGQTVLIQPFIEARSLPHAQHRYLGLAVYRFLKRICGSVWTYRLSPRRFNSHDHIDHGDGGQRAPLSGVA